MRSVSVLERITRCPAARVCCTTGDNLDGLCQSRRSNPKIRMYHQDQGSYGDYSSDRGLDRSWVVNNSQYASLGCYHDGAVNGCRDLLVSTSASYCELIQLSVLDD